MSSVLYEGMFLFDSNLASRDWPGLEHHVGEVLKKNSAELVYSERWPDRKLAHEIKGCKKGTYYLTYFKAPTDGIVGLQRDCHLSDRVLRLLVIQEDGLEEELEKRRSLQPKESLDEAGGHAAEGGVKPASEKTSLELGVPEVKSGENGKSEDTVSRDAEAKESPGKNESPPEE